MGENNKTKVIETKILEFDKASIRVQYSHQFIRKAY